MPRASRASAAADTDASMVDAAPESAKRRGDEMVSVSPVPQESSVDDRRTLLTDPQRMDDYRKWTRPPIIPIQIPTQTPQQAASLET